MSMDDVRQILMTLPSSDSGNYYHDDLLQAFARVTDQRDFYKRTSAAREEACENLLSSLAEAHEHNGVCVWYQNPAKFPHTCFNRWLCELKRQP